MTFNISFQTTFNHIFFMIQKNQASMFLYSKLVASITYKFLGLENYYIHYRFFHAIINQYEQTLFA